LDKKIQPWTLIYEQKYELKNDAVKREKQLKSAKGRVFVRSLIPN
jgi:putative endonuclease